jgi:hypothetical protein
MGIFYCHLLQIYCVNKKYFTTSDGSETVWFWESHFSAQCVVNMNDQDKSVRKDQTTGPLQFCQSYMAGFGHEGEIQHTPLTFSH